jgi:hypothetical protein
VLLSGERIASEVAPKQFGVFSLLLQAAPTNELEGTPAASSLKLSTGVSPEGGPNSMFSK